jgi:hypothetical protein
MPASSVMHLTVYDIGTDVTTFINPDFDFHLIDPNESIGINISTSGMLNSDLEPDDHDTSYSLQEAEEIAKSILMMVEYLRKNYA